MIEQVQQWAHDMLLLWWLLLLASLLLEPPQLCPKRVGGVGGSKGSTAGDGQRPVELLCAEACGREVGCHLLQQCCPVCLLLLHLQQPTAGTCIAGRVP